MTLESRLPRGNLFDNFNRENEEQANFLEWLILLFFSRVKSSRHETLTYHHYILLYKIK